MDREAPVIPPEDPNCTWCGRPVTGEPVTDNGRDWGLPFCSKDHAVRYEEWNRF